MEDIQPLKEQLQKWLDLMASIEWPEGMPSEVHSQIADLMDETAVLIAK